MATSKLRTVILRDPRGSRWNGCVCKVLAGPHLERSVSPGEIAVFEPTGEVVLHVEVTELRDGKTREKTVDALVYRRTGTLLVGTFATRSHAVVAFPQTPV